MRLRAVRAALVAVAIAAPAAVPASGAGDATARRLMPGIVSTPSALEIRVTFSPDGSRRLWGRIDPNGRRGFEIYETVRIRGGWTPPRPVPFNSDANDFDPSFAPDGHSILFFSNRPGGIGGDDIWTVAFDPRTGNYGTPRNIGAPINTPGNEWAPSITPKGELLFASNGHGGAGGQDLFTAMRTPTGWSSPRNLGSGVNGPADDFDAVVFRGNILVFTSGDAERGPISLYRVHLRAGAQGERVRLGPKFNCSPTFNLGPSWTPLHPDLLYFSARCPDQGSGGADVFFATLE